MSRERSRADRSVFLLFLNEFASKERGNEKSGCLWESVLSRECPGRFLSLWDSSLLGPGSRDGLRHPENAQRKQPQSVQKGLTRRRESEAAVQEPKSLPQLTI
jgi:hypothetical protein